MIRVADFVAQFIAEVLETKHVFMVTGAGIMHLTDGVACNTSLEAICVQHEQTASMALEAYSRMSGKIGVGYFSTGPAATNAVTGLGGAWQDSVACLFISGQVKLSETSNNSGVQNLRQFGVQELNILPIVQSLTKYTAQITKPEMIRFELEKAVHLAKTGRPGPVWLEIPMDIQAAWVDESLLPAFVPPLTEVSNFSKELSELSEAVKAAKRPVIIAGQGIRLGEASHELIEFAERFSIPVVTPYLGIDVISHDLDVYIGKTGVKGDRAANLSMQNADLILAIGTSLHVSVIGYDYSNFARGASKYCIDIDKTSHEKPTIVFDQLLEMDAKLALTGLLSLTEIQTKESEVATKSEWLTQCLIWKAKYPVYSGTGISPSERVNIYTFVETLSNLAGAGDVVVSDAGSAFYAVSQGIRLSKPGQRYITSGGMATMGYSLPAAIGVSLAQESGQTLAVTGDGSLQQNIQEFQTLVGLGIPVKLFVLNNDGYLSIRASQNNYYEGRLIGSGPSSGVTLPDTVNVASAYGLASLRIRSNEELEAGVKKALAHKGPIIVDILCPPDQPIIPTVASSLGSDGKMRSRPLEDMAPFLDRDEYLANMYIEAL